MSINREALARFTVSHYAGAVSKTYGDAGTRTMRMLFESIRRIYAFLDIERFEGELFAFCPLDVQNLPLKDLGLPDPVRVTDAAQFAIVHGPTVVIQVLGDGTFLLWQGVEIDSRSLCATALVYRYNDASEYVLTIEEAHPIEKVQPHARSIFCAPTLADLEEALAEYSQSMVRETTCNILKDIWADGNRLYLKLKPEATIRQSLTNFLHSKMSRTVEVRPEQNVDASHPVDIKLTWRENNRRAIIEIKWLGKSIDQGAESTSYSAGRAREGAKQLDEYLTATKQHDPNDSTIGILVVLDARRAGTAQLPATVSREDALKYERAEIEFSPRYWETRSDFRLPWRMFAMPVLTA